MVRAPSPRALLLCSWAVLLVASACSKHAPPAQSAAESEAVECTAADARGGAPDAATLRTLRQSVEDGPLYATLAMKGALAACRVSSKSSAVTVEYAFRDGGSLRVTHDPRIEYNNQEARFASPPTEDPAVVLQRVERAAFDGNSGCGIDWQAQEAETANDDAAATVTVYRGDVCNCQARVRRTASGRVIGLVLRSTC